MWSFVLLGDLLRKTFEVTSHPRWRTRTSPLTHVVVWLLQTLTTSTKCWLEMRGGGGGRWRVLCYVWVMGQLALCAWPLNFNWPLWRHKRSSVNVWICVVVVASLMNFSMVFNSPHNFKYGSRISVWHQQSLCYKCISCDDCVWKDIFMTHKKGHQLASYVVLN